MKYYKFSKSRKSRLEDSGRTFYCNESEDALAVNLSKSDISFTKRGYPDFTVLNKDGTIYGFVEVKNRDEKFLKKEQKVFAIFCHDRNIPYLKWCPKDGVEPLDKFLEGRMSQ